MSFGYFSQLTQKEKKELLNWCIKYRNYYRRRNEPILNLLTDHNSLKENGPVCSNNTRYKIIETPSGEFWVNDFYIFRKDDKRQIYNAEFSSLLRVFMTIRFGSTYSEALYDCHMQEWEEERQNTKSYRKYSIRNVWDRKR